MQAHAAGDVAPEGAASDTRPVGFALLVDRMLETACVGLMLVAVGVSCIQVTLRYGFNSGLPWPEELATFVFAWAVFIGMAIATGREAHIAIDVVTRVLPERPRAALDLFNRAVMAAASIMLMVHGWDYVTRAIAASPALQWPMKYFFLAAPVGGALNLSFSPGRNPAARWSIVSASCWVVSPSIWRSATAHRASMARAAAHSCWLSLASSPL
jgi:TRAP-type C4-dicarboxylate transport system permease small subunit